MFTLACGCAALWRYMTDMHCCVAAIACRQLAEQALP
jgi:hypothetical protein